jgi:hypothetical protein
MAKSNRLDDMNFRHYGIKGLVLNIPWSDNAESVVINTLHADTEPEQLPNSQIAIFWPLIYQVMRTP